MPQENMSSFMAYAKEYAKAEKELEVQRWVYISIERKDNNGERVRLFHYDLPREVYERRDWAIRWREAKLRCKYPKDNVQCYFSFYDKRIGNDKNLTADLKKLISCKAKVTRQQRIIDDYVAYQRANNLFFDENSDKMLVKMLNKLAVKISDVKTEEEKLWNKIEEIKNK